MSLKNISALCLFVLSALVLHAQAPPTPGQTSGPKPPPDVVAGIPVNYDEAKVGTYTLPDPLKLNNGKPVRDAKTWYAKRRPEIVEMFETQQYGRAPGRPKDESFEVFDKGTPALNGKAIRKQVTIYLSKDKSWPKIDLLIYLPATAKRPVPMFLSINFGAVSNAVDDPGIKPGEVWDPKTNTKIPAQTGRGFGRMNVEPLLDAGIGVATFYYGDVDPDYLNGFSNGIRARYLKPGETQRTADDWGSIAAWAWGMSRVEDYFETDKSIDAKRIAIHGVSRLGKTVMWAGAHDQRFAAVIASCSGEGGAALSSRNYGETIDFDGKRVLLQPTAQRIAELDAATLAKKCKLGYRAKYIVASARMIEAGFPDIQEIMRMPPSEAKEKLVELPGIGDYAADIINPHAGFPIDAWSVDVFGLLFFGKEPENKREAIEKVKEEGLRRWGEWSWMAFFYVAQDLRNLSKQLGVQLRLE